MSHDFDPETEAICLMRLGAAEIKIYATTTDGERREFDMGPHSEGGYFSHVLYAEAWNVVQAEVVESIRGRSSLGGLAAYYKGNLSMLYEQGAVWRWDRGGVVIVTEGGQ